jgi:hypothetical protein
VKGVLAGGEADIVSIAIATHFGMTTDEFSQIVRDWITSAKHPATKRLYTEMVYQPMLELVAYLRANDFKTFIVSGGGIDFMHPWTERVYGISADQVVGSAGKLRFEMRDGNPVLVKLPEISMINARFMELVHHTDAEGEWAYDRKSSIGRLDKALDKAQTKDWNVVDMKMDWKTIFPFGSK